MKTFIFGINHKTASIEIREQLFLNPLQQDLFLSELKSYPHVSEAMVLSTCNRTEVYLRAWHSSQLFEDLLQLISRIKKMPLAEELKQHFYYLEDREATRHLFRVTSGLDSLVLGEKQIIGQVKMAVDRARAQSMMGKYFNILSNVAIRTGKKAQTETDISCGGSSVSWAAIRKAEQILGTLSGRSLLIIGAGKMGELTLKQIRNKGAKNIYLMNRTGTAAQTLAETCQAIPVSFEDIKETLSEVDICVCAANAPHFILDKKMIEKIMALRQNRALILIDISMPRNIDPLVGGIERVTLFHIDNLQSVVQENMLRRQNAVAQVQAMIEDKIQDFYVKISKLKSSPQMSEFLDSSKNY